MKHLEHGFSVGFYAPGVGMDGPIDATIGRDGISAVLHEDFVVYLPGVGLITVPAGFSTNFASSPRIFWRIIPPWGNYSPAAVVHDWLYATGTFSRAMSDLVFLELMIRVGVPKWKANLMYLALRAFGWVAWNKCRREQK